MNKLPAPIIDKRFHADMMRLEPMHADDPDFLAMVAFASELCGDYLTAEVRAERALRVEPRNPWAQHALAHVLIRQGRVPEGWARTEAFMPLLATCGRPINSHDAWPLAILYLEELDVAATLRVFRDHIYCATRCGNVHAIHDAHYVYALMRAGRDQAVDTALASIRERGIADDDEGKKVWSPVGCAVVEAAACFGAGNRTRAAQLLDPVMPLMTSIGGSDAQDDLFRQAYLRSLQAARREAEATVYFKTMTANKHRTRLDRLLAN